MSSTRRVMPTSVCFVDQILMRAPWRCFLCGSDSYKHKTSLRSSAIRTSHDRSTIFFAKFCVLRKCERGQYIYIAPKFVHMHYGYPLIQCSQWYIVHTHNALCRPEEKETIVCLPSILAPYTSRVPNMAALPLSSYLSHAAISARSIKFIVIYTGGPHLLVACLTWWRATTTILLVACSFLTRGKK
jgi:hypothetical protein